MKIIRNLPDHRWQEIHSYCLELAQKFAQPEQAYCARGRLNFWLQAEPNYATKTYKPAQHDDRLWNFCKKIMPNADLAQIFLGNRGIDWHRDAAYAATTARILNLGYCTWQIKE